MGFPKGALRSQRSNNFNLTCKIQSRLKFSILTFIVPQKLRHFLPVQHGLRQKLKFWQKNAQNLCTHILGSPTPILCANCAGAPPHKFRTISAHFRMPPHIFRTNFLGPVGNAPRISFAQFSRAHGLFSKSAPVQAMNVSTQKQGFGGWLA